MSRHDTRWPPRCNPARPDPGAQAGPWGPHSLGQNAPVPNRLTPTRAAPPPWRSIVALNGVSTLAQIGQYGLGTTLLPLALEARGASPWQIGVASAALWFGMLAGLLLAGGLTRRLGYRLTVVAGLALSALAFTAMPWLPWAAWSVPSAAIGMGLGLRWIANETWLYRLAPAGARGRIVGIHETLIGIASIAGPVLVVATGALKPDAFLIGAALTASAALPLWLATPLDATAADTNAAADAADAAGARPDAGAGSPWARLAALAAGLSIGAWVAGLGGWMEGSLLALLPVLATDQGLSSASAAWLLTLLGIGATASQFPIGWLADLKGVVWTARVGTALAGLATLAVLLQPGALTLAAMALALGAVSGGMLTLGMVFASSGGDGAAITARVRQVSVLYTTLSGIGPLVAGAVVDRTGQSMSLMVLQAAIVVTLAVVLRPRAGQRQTRSEAG